MVAAQRKAGVDYILSTGGAAGSFTCGSDGGMDTFIDRRASPNLIGVDFDIEAGQSQQVINDLVARIGAAHGKYPSSASRSRSRRSQTMAARAPRSRSGSRGDRRFNTYGDETLDAVKSTLGFDGSASTWPSYLTVDLMTMDYGSPSSGVCVVANGACEMGQSAIQAAYNLRDKWGVPLSNIELTPMLGGQ